jgi:hypothetical protein
MGILFLGPFVTEDGFQIDNVYMRLNGMQVYFNQESTDILCTFDQYQSRDIRIAGKRPLGFPIGGNVFSIQLDKTKAYDLPLTKVVYTRVIQLLKETHNIDAVLEEGQEPYVLPEGILYLPAPAVTATTKFKLADDGFTMIPDV